MIARVAVSSATFAIDRPYDYIIPEELSHRITPGMRALVPFGRGDKKSEAIVLSIESQSNYKKLKQITLMLDEEPVLSDENIKLALWMSDRFFCTVFDALRAMLPAGMWYKESGTRQLGKTQNFAFLNIHSEEAVELAAQKQVRAPQQAAILKLLAGTEEMSVKDICGLTGASESSVKALEKSGVISIVKREILRRPAIHILQAENGRIDFELNSEQSKVVDSIIPLLHKESPEAALLYGVTGSGKTMVYIRLIEEVIKMGKTAVVLVPEIALTPQVMSIFSSHFGDEVAVLHSALGVGERYDEWKRIRSGSVRVVVGTRSAVFAPLENIGLIVIDEEQEHTYKSENNPRYHARDVAKFRVTQSNGVLLLSSATPSVESMYNAQVGKYKLFRIDKRYNEKNLPNVLIVDMKQELKNGNGGSISSVLRLELEKNISEGYQSILFLNRRGSSPLVACGECGFTYGCERCSISMTYHSKNERLLCHYCGFSHKVPQVCGECGGKLRYIGAGTQKVESELLALFPDVKIIRMDADAVTRKNSHDKLLSDFREKNAQILLGTQMITKGLDFENVTLVGVVSADMSLYFGDYRSHERTFSLITQVVGRSGRGDKPGRAVIQTFTPAHEVIELSSKQDFDGFYEREIALRSAMESPPISDLLSIIAIGECEKTVLTACQKIRDSLHGYFKSITGVVILGPAPPPVYKVNNSFRYRLLIKCTNTKEIRKIIAHTLREFSRDKFGKGVSVFADTDV
jgi:primosomal protein N' (replication factor Y)